MPVQHIVLLKLLPDSNPTDVENLLSAVRRLENEIPGILKVRGGVQTAMYQEYVDRSHGYTHLFEITAVDRKALSAYDKHPAHLKFRNDYMLPLMDPNTPPLVVDYEFEAGSCPHRLVSQSCFRGGRFVCYAAQLLTYAGLIGLGVWVAKRSSSSSSNSNTSPLNSLKNLVK